MNIHAQKIIDLILTGELKPGNAIKGDYLKSRLNLGLSPIREALFGIQSTGLLDLHPNSGFKVKSLSADQISDFYLSYAYLECALLELSIQNGSEAWEANIMGALYHLAKAEKKSKSVSYKNWNEINDKFHDSLLSAVTCSHLFKVRDSLLLIRDWYQAWYYDYNLQRKIEVFHDEHEQLAKLVIERKTAQAKIVLFNHSLYFKDKLITKLNRYK